MCDGSLGVAAQSADALCSNDKQPTSRPSSHQPGWCSEAAVAGDARPSPLMSSILMDVLQAAREALVEKVVTGIIANSKNEFYYFNKVQRVCVC